MLLNENVETAYRKEYMKTLDPRPLLEFFQILQHIEKY